MTAYLPPLLVIDDEPNMRSSLAGILTGEDYGVRTVESAEQGLLALGEGEYFMVITDARLQGMSGYEFLRRVRSRWPDLPVLIITAFATPKLAVEAIKAGAIDYLAKPFAPEELLHAVERCAEHYRLVRENAALRAQTEEPYRLDEIIGESEGMRELRQLIGTVAPSDATVLILGESGTGKELVAGAIHNLSRRRTRPYVRINCAAIPETLLESELFGHEKGAFTGAIRQKPGRVEEADRGTVFLDEIGDMSRSLQAKLLRFLEDGTFSRVGGVQELRVDVRLIAATNRDIITAIRQGEFREDLYHRLNVVQFRPPPLRDRQEDVVLLAEHFLRRFNVALNKSIGGLSPAARQCLRRHHWPGNVRELRNVIERAVILETSNEIQLRSLPDFELETGLRKGGVRAELGLGLEETLEQVAREMIVRVLERQQYNLAKSADELRITRHALRYRMNRLKIAPPEGTMEAADGSLARDEREA
ncbi:MAG: sigma-54 dependent transcriptional regulator [Verrucomicrobia bacterium]|nr:sigma-54 dependent transcriptional regulator [Verrucomicrobiota bacterium]